jgi:hypothetical protein
MVSIIGPPDLSLPLTCQHRPEPVCEQGRVFWETLATEAYRDRSIYLLLVTFLVL